jgi:hypothetical protein
MRHGARVHWPLLRYLPAIRYIARTMPWLPLLAGCAVGVVLSVTIRTFTHPSMSPDTILLAGRAVFAPVVVASGFLPGDPHRNLTVALPAPYWLSTAVRIILAIPVVAVTALIQLELTAADLGITLPPPAEWPMTMFKWLSLAVELTAWCLTCLAIAAVVSRTRWVELSGTVAAPATVAIVGCLAFSAVGVFPSIASGPSDGVSWGMSDGVWSVLGVVAALLLFWSCRDPWLRVRPGRL